MSGDPLSAIFTADVSPEWGNLCAGGAATLTFETLAAAMDEARYGPLPTVDDILNEGLQREPDLRPAFGAAERFRAAIQAGDIRLPDMPIQDFVWGDPPADQDVLAAFWRDVEIIRPRRPAKITDMDCSS